MSKKNDHNKESNSGLLSKVKEKSAQVTHQQDNKYVPPQEFQSKTPKETKSNFLCR